MEIFIVPHRDSKLHLRLEFKIWPFKIASDIDPWFEMSFICILIETGDRFDSS